MFQVRVFAVKPLSRLLLVWLIFFFLITMHGKDTTAKMDFFCENSYGFLTPNDLRRKAPL